MHSDLPEQEEQRRDPIPSATTESPDRVSGRFLTDFFRALDRLGLPAVDLLGDLPVPLGEHGEVTESVEWDHFVEFMRRLGRAVGGPSELEQVSARLGPLKPAKALA